MLIQTNAIHAVINELSIMFTALIAQTVTTTF
jgi:hypothetical protein